MDPALRTSQAPAYSSNVAFSLQPIRRIPNIHSINGIFAKGGRLMQRYQDDVAAKSPSVTWGIWDWLPDHDGEDHGSPVNISMRPFRAP